MTLFLVGRGGPQGGVECQVGRVARGGLRADVSSALAVSAGLAPTTTGGAGQSVEGGVYPPGDEFFAGGDLLTALPPFPFRGPLGNGLQCRLLIYQGSLIVRGGIPVLISR